MRAAVILNADAGSIRPSAVAETLRFVRERFALNGWSADVRGARGTAMAKLLTETVGSGADALIVGGGDGTVSHAVAATAGTPRIVGLLPLGTFNLLGRDIGMPGDLGAAIDGLCRGTPRAVDLGRINGRPFHSLSGLGFFSRYARERERVRRRPRLPRWIGVAVAITRAALRPHILRLEIEADGARRAVEAVAMLVTNNRFAREDWRRERLDDGVLEVHVLVRCPMPARLRAGLDVIRGRWRDNPLIETISAKSIVVASRRPRLWVATDGELTRETTPLRYCIEPGALTLLAPAGQTSVIRGQ